MRGQRLFFRNDRAKNYRARHFENQYRFSRLIVAFENGHSRLIAVEESPFVPLISSKSLLTCTDVHLFFSVSPRLPVFYRSDYIFSRGRPRSYVADVFSRFISEILSWSNFHCDLAVRYTFSYTPTCTSQCHPLSSRPSPLALPFCLSFFFCALSAPCGSIASSVYRSDSTHSRAVSYSWPLWQ